MGLCKQSSSFTEPGRGPVWGLLGLWLGVEGGIIQGSWLPSNTKSRENLVGLFPGLSGRCSHRAISSVPCVSGVQPCGFRKLVFREKKAKEKAAQGQKRPKAWPKRRCLSWPWALDPSACVTLIQRAWEMKDANTCPKKGGSKTRSWSPGPGPVGHRSPSLPLCHHPPASSQSLSLGCHLVVKWPNRNQGHD